MKKLVEEWTRIKKAAGYSLAGLRVALEQKAFRTELLLAAVLIPLAFVATRFSGQRMILIASVLLVLVVELLNSAIETAIDRISPELHELSKKAKDLGSAAVFVSLVNVGIVWLVALFS